MSLLLPLSTTGCRTDACGVVTYKFGSAKILAKNTGDNW